MSLRRTTAIVRKELIHILRDPRNLFLVTVSPAFLLFLLAYVFTTRARITAKRWMFRRRAWTVHS